MTTQTPQTNQTPQSSTHLIAALELLDGLEPVSHGPDADPHTRAITATAHSILVLAEQVAAVRVLMVGDVMSRGSNGQPAPSSNSQPAPQDKTAPRKRGWW